MRAYTKQVLLGLHYLHTQCLDGHYVMHRDIKVSPLPLQAARTPPPPPRPACLYSFCKLRTISALQTGQCPQSN